MPPRAGRRYRAEGEEIQPSRQIFNFRSRILQTTPPTIHHHHPPLPLNVWTNERNDPYHTFFPSPRNSNLSTYEPSTTPHQYRKVLGTALERLWTLNLSSSLPYTPPTVDCQSRQTDTRIPLFMHTNAQTFPSVPSLSISSLSTHNLWHSGFRSNPPVGIGSNSIVNSTPSAFFHPLWLIVLSSFLAHHPTLTPRHTPAYLKPSCYKPALKANVLFSFSRTSFLHTLSPPPLFFFATVMVALRVSICILRFLIFFFPAGRSCLCSVGGWVLEKV